MGASWWTGIQTWIREQCDKDKKKLNSENLLTIIGGGKNLKDTDKSQSHICMLIKLWPLASLAVYKDLKCPASYLKYKHMWYLFKSV